MFNYRTALLGFIIIISIQACNLPTGEQDLPPGDVQTAAALTVDALITTPLASATIQAPLLPDTPTPTFSPTGTITPTYSVPILSVLEQTNCREGPGQDYEVVFTYLPKKKLEILGRYDPNNYWLVKSSDSLSGECWLWGEYVEVTGSYWAVSSVTPPPTKTPAPPAAPSIQKWDFFCNSVTGEMNTTIQWTDNANNEIGYRVIRDNTIISELPANSSTYTETILLSSGESVTYFIEVHNVTGSVRSTPINLTC
ncbi:MAG TPA: SH3 domain-containing protein [Anaerolineales bacterium]|nr:SH3 domain-containing protein [Anaerolineales bacterium]